MENNLYTAQILKLQIETESILNRNKRKNEAHEWLKEKHKQKYVYKEHLYVLILQDKINKSSYKAQKRELLLQKLREELES